MLVPLALDLPIYSLVLLALYAVAAYLLIQVENSGLTWAPRERRAYQFNAENESARTGRALSLALREEFSGWRSPTRCAECPIG